MSSMESKAVLRLEVESLYGKNNHEAYQILKDIIGEAEEVYLNSDNTVDVFFYEGKYDVLSNDDRWYIDLVLNRSVQWGDEEPLVENIHTIMNKAQELSLLFNEDISKIRLVSYQWYNGVDEPVYY